jgi:hypothetical protein
MNIVSNFVQLESNGLEFVVETDSGLAYASVSAAARMLDRNESTIRTALTSRNIATKEAQIQTTTGFKTSRLLASDDIFDLAFEYNLPLAKQMGKAGANLYILGLAGYKTQVVEKAPTNQLPEAFQTNSFEWGDRNKSKQKWEINKLLKKHKGKVAILTTQEESFLMIHAMTEAGVRILTWFSEVSKPEQIHEMFVVTADRSAIQKDCQLQGNFIASFE